MSQSQFHKICETIQVSVVTKEDLATAKSPNHTLCAVCFDDFKPGDQVARNNCCGTLACLGCLSKCANMRRPEEKGGLPVLASCQLCGAEFDRKPLNACVRPGDGEEDVPAIKVLSASKEIDVSLPPSAPHDPRLVSEIPDVVLFNDGIEKLTKRGGTHIYATRFHNYFIDEDFYFIEGQTLDQNGALGWGRWVARNDVPKKSRVTREETLAGMRESTYFEYGDDVSEEDGNESDDAEDED
jgi:hypothetical protein